jgi:hypothetical protein
VSLSKDAMLTPSIFYYNAPFLHRDKATAFRPRLEPDLYPERIEWAEGQTIQSLLN